MAEQENPFFDRSLLHPGAAAAINRDGLALLEAQQLEQLQSEQPPEFQSRRIPEATITDADIIGEPLSAWSNMAGQTVGRYFVQDGKVVALREQGYRQLRQLAEKVLRAKPFSSGLSRDFVEIEIFKWWRARLRGEADRELSTALLDASSEAVGEHRMMVPLSNIEIERPFEFGDVLVTPFNQQLIDDFEADGLRRFPDRAADIQLMASRLRKDFGHLTAIQVDIVGERGFARDRIREIAFDVADIFRFMSPPAVSWNIVFACFPAGFEHEPRATVIELRDDRLGEISTGLLGAPSFRWMLSFAELDRDMTTNGFRHCATFLGSEPLTGFQKRVKTGISAYTQGVATTDIRNRLIYAMSAAEHLLLRDENEPIQTSAGERMAFLIAKDADTRRSVVANFKKAYGLRSRSVHHLAMIDNEDVLSEFFKNMWVMLITAIQNMQRFKEHADFLDAIDRAKFGG